MIETAGLVLEPQVAAHADAMFIVLSDPAIYEHENAPPASVDALRERYRKLETRRSRDGREQWLNWVVRLPGGELAGYVQATVYPDAHASDIAYEFASRYWGRGIARAAVEAMIGELVTHHGVRALSAIVKRSNERSRRFLERLGFALTSPEAHQKRNVDADELLMERSVASPRLEFDVFGKRMLVKRVADGWQAFLLGTDGKRSPVDIAIPSSVGEGELLQYLDDLYHELATPANPCVRQLDGGVRSMRRRTA